VDSLYNLLANRNFDEPPEVASIKQFVRDNYKAQAGVAVKEREIIITVDSASLASRLRFDIQRLKEAAGTEKRLILRIQR
jgi:hypothetical protein